MDLGFLLCYACATSRVDETVGRLGSRRGFGSFYPSSSCLERRIWLSVLAATFPLLCICLELRRSIVRVTRYRPGNAKQSKAKQSQPLGAARCVQCPPISSRHHYPGATTPRSTAATWSSVQLLYLLKLPRYRIKLPFPATKEGPATNASTLFIPLCKPPPNL